jgi:Nif-specific regulatory protein
MSCTYTPQHVQSLLEVTHLLMRTVDPDEVLAGILTAAMRVFDAEGCSLALRDPTTHELAFVAMVGPAKVDAFRLVPGQGVAGWVAQTRRGVVCNDVAHDARFFRGVDQQTGYTTRALLCAPLLQHDRCLGVIEVLNTTRPAGFDAADLSLLLALGNLASTAITRTQTFARVCNVGTALAEVVQERYRLVRGTSPAMQETLRLAHTVAATPTTVLLLGESGTGKEVLARAIHQWSPRAAHPFVAVNCVTLTPELLASELFGHEKGAFTGAVAQKKGKFELAQGGTLFLDEIGDLSPELQAQLLRVLQEKEFQRVGGTKDLRVDVRLLAATNRDLQQAMQRGMFREDLYYRLNVVTLRLPPLRDRREDIPALLTHFLAHYSREVHRPGLTITPAALARLQAYPWPGNVRELQNAVERAVVLAPSSVLTVADFPPEICPPPDCPAVGSFPCAGHDDSGSCAVGAPRRSQPTAACPRPTDAARMQQVLIQTGGNVARAARLLGLSRDTMRYRMQQYGLARPQLEAAHAV